ncbi:matrilin-3a isoform X3 [Gasterosteus aculeatus]
MREAVRPQQDPLRLRADTGQTTGGGRRMQTRMKPFLWSVLSLLLLSDVLATYHLGVGDPQRIAAQSYAQTRTNGRPPFRTLNPQIHRSDYTYRGGYHYRYQPPRIPPAVSYRPVPLSPPVTYHRPPVATPHYRNPFRGPAAPQMHHVYKGLSPPVAQHPHRGLKGTFPYQFKGPCPNKSDPTVPTAPAVPRPTVPPFPTARPTLVTTGLPVVVSSARAVETTAPVRLLVSTQSGFIATARPVETGPEPCAMGHDCEHTCVNSNASYYCQCRNGYILNADKKTCSPKQLKAAEVAVADPCKCEARLAFQKQTHAAIQQLTAKLVAVSGRIERLENTVGRA